VILLIAGASGDHGKSAEVHVRAANLARTLIREINAAAPPQGPRVNLTLVNFPGYTAGYGFGAATFKNGIRELVAMTSPGVSGVELYQVSIPSAPLDFAIGAVPIEPEALKTKLHSLSGAALLFQMPNEVRRLSADGLERLVP
jgi:hypothetical protein